MSGKRRASPTGRDVAALAGVSPMTVSRVVSGNGNVDPALRAKVLDAVEKLGYEPNYNASAMRNPKGAGGAVGLCVETIQNPFSAGVARGLELALRPHGLMLFTGSSDGEPAMERELLLEFYRRRVSALVVMTVLSDHSFLVPRVHPTTPIVYVDRPAILTGCDTVTSDHAAGASAATAHMIEHGHRRIAFVGTNITGHPISERLTGFQSALSSAGIMKDDAPVLAFERDRGIPDVRQGTRELLQSADRPTAIFAASNSDLMGVRQALHDLELEAQIAHVAFDDLDLADVMSPPLSAFSQDPVELGRRCGECVIERLNATEPIEARTIVIQGKLIARGSGEISTLVQERL